MLKYHKNIILPHIRSIKGETTVANENKKKLDSAEKRVIIAAKRAAANKSALNEVKTSMKKLNAAIEAGDKAQAQEIFKETTKLLDSAVSAGRMHINTASNKKSGFAKRINKLA